MIAQSVASPVGILTLTEEDGRITRLSWGGTEAGRSPLLDAAARQLEAYFAGEIRRFTLPLAPQASAFQHLVFEAMLSIPYGETRSYGAVARSLEASAQAVGRACGANPVPILIPCHRIVGAGGLGGYSGRGGVETKRALLRLEGAAGLLL